MRRAAVSSRARARLWVVTGFWMIRPSARSLRTVWRELALASSEASLGSSQILRLPQPATLAARRFCVRRFVLMKHECQSDFWCRNEKRGSLPPLDHQTVASGADAIMISAGDGWERRRLSMDVHLEDRSASWLALRLLWGCREEKKRKRVRPSRGPEYQVVRARPAFAPALRRRDLANAQIRGIFKILYFLPFFLYVFHV